MPRSYDIFLSHSGAQKWFVEQLYTELRQQGRYSVFFDADSIKHGEQISPILLEYTTTCKLAVAVLSEEYFTRSRPPMMELAASYTAAKDGNGVPCLLPVFFGLKPEHVKDSETQMEWMRTWEEWAVNEIMSESRTGRSSRVQPQVWKEALRTLLDTRGPVYKPPGYKTKPTTFSKDVARVISERLDELTRTMVIDKDEDKEEEKVKDNEEEKDEVNEKEENDNKDEEVSPKSPVYMCEFLESTPNYYPKKDPIYHPRKNPTYYSEINPTYHLATRSSSSKSKLNKSRSRSSSPECCRILQFFDNHWHLFLKLFFIDHALN